MKKKLTAFFLSLLMSVQMIPLFALAEEAETPAESGITLELPEHIALQEETAPAQADLTEADNQYAAYSFNETTQKLTKTLCDIPSATTITGTTTVWETGWYIADGTVELSSARVGGDVKLVLKDGCKLTVGGITVTESDSLTIYAQKNGTGELISAASANNYAGIGGGSKEDGGIITIHGGKITATGGEMAAGIGGGSQGACGTVTIYGGEVTAAGGFNGAGIGTGSAPKNSGGSIAVYGGTVTVSTTDNSAMGDQRPRAIGGGFNGSVDTITINREMEVKDGSGNAVTLNNTWAETLTGCSYTFRYMALPAVEYRYFDVPQQKFLTGECDTYTVVTSETTTWADGWYVVNEDVTIPQAVGTFGDVHLILTDGKTLTISGSLGIGNDCIFSIYAQSDEKNMGKLKASRIGGNLADDITVFGGDITLKNSSSYGIKSTGYVEIYDGSINITADGENGKGIEADKLIIYDGSVMTTGGQYGIYCTDYIMFKGGNIIAKSGEDGNAVFASNDISMYSMVVCNEAGERLTLPQTMPEYRAFLTDTYYRFIAEDLVVPYRYYDEATGAFKDGECPDYELIDGDRDALDPWGSFERDKWYVVKGNVTITGVQGVVGNVHLILTDDCVLTAEDGITVSDCFSIYAQERNTGVLRAGNLTAKSIEAGIGLGMDTSTVNIHGGVVIAESYYGAGIGGRSDGLSGATGGMVNIHGGVVTATSTFGAGIGGGYGKQHGGAGGTVRITGGSVTAKGSTGIGGGYGNTERGEAATVTLGDNMVVIDGGLGNSYQSVKIVEAVPYRYYDEATGAFKDGKCIDYEVIDKDTTEWEIPENDDEKWYVVKGEAEISGRPTVSGKVHLILTDDCVLTVEDGINVYIRNSLSIYGQENGTGKLCAGNDEHNVPYAGIGGGLDAGKVEIHGGEVSAKSEFGAGIGGGYDGGFGGTVNIHGGVVTATSRFGAGIGGGYGDIIGGNGGSVTITGGVVTATSFRGAGIGGGYGERDRGQAATVTLGDNMVVSEGSLVNTCYSVKIVEKELHAPTMLPKTSIRTSGTPGLRFAAYVTDAQREASSSYGFLVARENNTLKNDPTKLVFNDAHSASGTNTYGVTYTSGEAYNKTAGIDKTYADDGTEFGLSDVEATFFTGVMQGIPKAFYAENLIARPYMVVDGVTIYGETYSKSLYVSACAIRDGGYQGLDEDGIKYINSIISAVDSEAEIDVGGLTQ